MLSDIDKTIPSRTEELVIKPEVVQKIQDSFCEAAGVFVVCLDGKRAPLTRMSGEEREAARIEEILDSLNLRESACRILDSSLEDQTVIDVPGANMKVAVVSVKLNHRPVMNWLLCGVMDDEEDFGANEKITDDIYMRTDEERFLKAVDFIRIASEFYVEETAAVRDDRERSKELHDQVEKLQSALKKRESMTQIVKLLDSDESFEEILRKALSIAGEFSGISDAFVLRINPGMNSVDCLAAYSPAGEKPLFPEDREIPRPRFLTAADKPVFLSEEGKIPLDMEKALRTYGIYAMAILPVFSGREAAMCVCYAERRQKRAWNLEEIKFFNDTTRILQSVFTRRVQKNSLVSSYATLEEILNHVGSSIYVRDKKTHEILFANQVLRENFEEELKGDRLHLLFEQGEPADGGMERRELYDGVRKKWYELYSTEIVWVDGRKVSLFAIYDITDKKEYQREIEHQANNDFLTGLYNRMCCEKDLQMYVREAENQNTRGSLLYLDLDDFKHINDGLGHQYGDVLLKAIAHSLQRIEEISGTCYRVGGDEFVIIVPELVSPQLDGILNRIRDIFSKPWFLKGSDYYCTMSMGVVTFPDEGRSVDELIKKADIAMYEAKNRGKNRISWYEENVGNISHRRLDMEKNMREAANDGYKEFEIYYQPITDIRREDNPCVGAEALIRWKSRKLGFVGPMEFIPLAEYLGLINPIGNYVLKEACRELKRWNESGRPYFKVNVNLSVIQLLQADIVETVAGIVREEGINPRNLTLEVTEGLAINDMERMKRILERIRSLGVRIALDDFGTGYSSLNYIREIPLDIIKVDQSFVKDLAEDPFSQSFIKMVAELAHAIGVKICVEGIETREQLKVLEDMRVRMVQGYYFGKPMPAGQFWQRYVDNRTPQTEPTA